MSIRIHQLSKKIGMDNKDLLALLQERGYSVTSASSTIDNISADSLVQEFGIHDGDAAEMEEEEPKAAAATAAPETEVAPPSAPPPLVAPPAAKLPPGIFVKSLEQIETERREKEAAKAAARVVPTPVMPAPRPPPPRPAAPAGPAPKAPPAAPPMPSRSAPATVVASAPAPASPPPAPPPVMRPPAPPPMRSGPVSMAPPAPPKPPGAVPASAPSVAAPPASGVALVVPGPTGDVKIVQIKPPIVVREFAVLLGLKNFKLISELMEMGIFAGLNQSIDENVASQIAGKHGFLLDIKHRGETPVAREKPKPPEPKVDESKFLVPRPPVVCIMGHVDHGKTTLLDKIRSANVAAGEAGGITQHIGAYRVAVKGKTITFIDTPGHAAFNQMRARGAKVTDIAVLVVAADDGFMPQTDEALQHIRAAEVTPIVAINKIDAKGANLDRVKGQMQERNLMPEDWGGEVITVPVSAIRGDGIEQLLEMILLQAEIMELKANPTAPASGVIIEAEIEIGRGPTATVLVENGTLRTGESLVCGPHYAKVRAMFDDQGQAVKEAPPSSAVRVIGWSGTPECGAIARAVKNEREAKRVAEEAEFELRKQAGAAPATKPVSVENLFEAIAAQRKRMLRVVIKADVFGSVEAVVAALGTIKSDKVSLEVVASDVGPVSKNDVLMASAAKAVIVGFNVRAESGVDALAKHHSVAVNHYEIIYELVDRVRDMMADLLEPETRELKLGAAEVRAVFPISKGFVAGCLVTEGRVQMFASARVRRAGKVETESRIVTLRRVKEEVKEVRAGTECGIRLENFDSYQPGDVIECYEIQKLRPSL